MTRSAIRQCVASDPMTREWKTAIQHGVVDELGRLHAAGADVDARDEHGQTGLMIAAVAGRMTVVEWLIRRAAEIGRAHV